MRPCRRIISAIFTRSGGPPTAAVTIGGGPPIGQPSTSGGGGGGGGGRSAPPAQQSPTTGNPGQPNKQLTCLAEAAKDKGVSIVLDAVGTIPAVGNAIATIGRIARGAMALDHGITKPFVPIASAAYSGYGAITGKPENQLDNFIGLSSAGGGIGLTFADLALGGTKAIPVVGNILSGATLLWDGYQAYQAYQACMAKPD